MRSSFRLHCLKRVIDGKFERWSGQLSRWKYFKTAILCWTIYDHDKVKPGINWVIIFPGGKGGDFKKYYEDEKKILSIKSNSLLAYAEVIYV